MADPDPCGRTDQPTGQGAANVPAHRTPQTPEERARSLEMAQLAKQIADEVVRIIDEKRRIRAIAEYVIEMMAEGESGGGPPSDQPDVPASETDRQEEVQT